MEKLNEPISLFLPIINTLQEKSLDGKISFELDFQNNELYTLQELTRCSAIINFIHSNGKISSTLNDVNRPKVNIIFDTFIQIHDPMAVFLKNFEQFFAMYIHSKYGKNNFQIYMKECEKSPVAYPISVFEDGMCIFMQYNTTELRNYVYNIITMFYYYTGQNFYEMIKPNINKIPRPNTFDEYIDNLNYEQKTPKNTNYTTVKSRQEKLCLLNRRNYNVKKPYITQQNSNDTLFTNIYFDNCILTNIGNKQCPEIIVNNNIQAPIINRDLMNNDIKVTPTVGCNKYGNPNDAHIFKLSDKLQNTCNSNVDTTGTSINCRKKFIQTNFKSIWSCDNRRQLVSLTIIYSIMNVCVQKITYALLENNNMDSENNNDGSIDNTYNVMECSNDDSDKSKSFIKIKKPTLEVSFSREHLKRQDLDTANVNIKFST